MWTNIKSVYSKTGIVQRAFLWVAFGLVVATALCFPFFIALIVALAIGLATMISVVDFLYKVIDE